MFISRQREKLINAIIFFVTNTKRCHTLKLFKLLNFLDFEHYRQTGMSVTGMAYKAWRNGPAPAELWRELQNPRADLAAAVAVVPVKDDITDALLRRELKPRRAFDASHFTKREIEIMKILAEFFEEIGAEDMTQVSHARGLPWGKIYQGGRGESQVIPYDLSIASEAVIGAMPSLTADELAYRKEVMRERQ